MEELNDLHCPRCGYSLRGLTEHRCPECGTAFDPDELKRDNERRQRSGFAELLAGSVVILLAYFTTCCSGSMLFVPSSDMVPPEMLWVAVFSWGPPLLLSILHVGWMIRRGKRCFDTWHTTVKKIQIPTAIRWCGLVMVQMMFVLLMALAVVLLFALL